MPISDVMTVNVVTVGPQTTVEDVARRMVATHVGSALVCDGPSLLGILTERDVMRLVADGRDAKTTPVDEIMTAGPVCAEPDWEIPDAARLMVSRGIRHLPVTQEGKILGMVSIRDLVRFGVAASKSDQERGREILEVATGKE